MRGVCGWSIVMCWALEEISLQGYGVLMVWWGHKWKDDEGGAVVEGCQRESV
jgi:hypothetical protein